MAIHRRAPASRKFIPTNVAVMVSTPALQTNFSPTSAAFWQQVYLDMATVLTAAGTDPVFAIW